MIDTLSKPSNRKAAKSVSRYIFSILYTNSPHDKLIKTLNFVTDFTRKSRTQNKISISNYTIAD